MDELLLVRSFLKSIGFNLKANLIKSRYNVHDEYCNDNEHTNIKLATLKYQGFSYSNSDDNPIELSYCLAAGTGEDSEESISNAFNKIVNEAKQNGFSKRDHEQVINLLKKYKNVFRNNLRKDPSADVLPLGLLTISLTTAAICNAATRFFYQDYSRI